MQADADVLHRGVTVLSYSFSNAHGLGDRLLQAVSEAERTNMSKKFKKCSANIKEAAQKVHAAGVQLSQMARLMQRMEFIVREMDS